MGVITKNKEDSISFSIKVPVNSYIDKKGEEKDKLIGPAGKRVGGF